MIKWYMAKYKKLLAISIFISLLLFFGSLKLVLAQTYPRLEVTYPTLHYGPPPSLISYLPYYIRYIYYFTITFIGVIVLGVLIVGGIRFLTSAGNPEQMQDAKQQMIYAFIGLVIILGATIALNEINPQLLTLEPPTLRAMGRGIIIYTDSTCGNHSDGTPGVHFPLPAGVRYEKVEATKSLSASFDIQSFYTFQSSDKIKIKFFKNPDCIGDPIRSLPDTSLPSYGANSCVQINIVRDVECIQIIWDMPGVYLSNKENFRLDTPLEPGQKFEIFQTSQDSFPNWLHDNVRSLALKAGKDEYGRPQRYGAILHNLPRVANRHAGWAHVYLPTDEEVTYFNTPDSQDASSLTVFVINEEAKNADLVVCENADCLYPEDRPSSITFHWQGGWESADGRSGGNGLVSLNNLPGYDDIVRGVRFDDVPGLNNEWWENGDDIEDGNGSFSGLLGGRNVSVFLPEGISYVGLEKGSSYLAILYDRKDAITNGPRIINGAGAIIPRGIALAIGVTAPDLAQLGFDNVIGSILLIKAKIL